MFIRDSLQVTLLDPFQHSTTTSHPSPASLAPIGGQDKLNDCRLEAGRLGLRLKVA
jgi:hypothetical protein